MSDIVVLNLADFHIKVEDDSNFERICASFIERLSKIVKDQEWRPDFICISGDIAYSGLAEEYTKAEIFIQEILKTCKLDKDRVLMAPGNHDLFSKEKAMKEPKNTDADYDTLKEKRRLYVEYANSYVEEVTLFLKKDNFHQNFTETKLPEVFKNYTTFRNGYNRNIKYKYNGLNVFTTKNMSNITGYKVFKEYRVVFWELNNSWYSLPFLNSRLTKGAYFGEHIIRHFSDQIKELKKDNYLVITLFHQPLQSININEYQPSGRGFCVYDEIVEVSDIIFSGHIHGPESKTPDNLANTAQYILTGAFYDTEAAKKTGAQSTDTNIPDCSASLIKIDPVNNLIQSRELYHKPRSGKWEMMEEKTLPLNYHSFLQERKIKNRDESSLKYKVIHFKNDLSETEENEIIARAYFGENSSIKEKGRSTKNANAIYTLTQQQNKYPVCFINIKEPEIDDLTANIKDNISTVKAEVPLYVVCKAPIGMFEPGKAEEIFKKLLKHFRQAVLRGNVVLFLCKIEKKINDFGILD